MFRRTCAASSKAASLSTISDVESYFRTTTSFGDLEELGFQDWKPTAKIPKSDQSELNKHLVNHRKCEIQPGRPALPVRPKVPAQSKQHKGRKTLVLDLDETMYHGNPYLAENMKERKRDCRPHYETFLKKATELFEVIVWTRSSGQAPRMKCEALGLKPVHILQGWGDCDGGGRKAMWKIDRDPKQIFLIDDDTDHLAANPRSQLLIPRWYSAQDDKQLHHALPLLEAIARAKTVQEVVDPYMAQNLMASDKRAAARATDATKSV